MLASFEYVPTFILIHFSISVMPVWSKPPQSGVELKYGEIFCPELADYYRMATQPYTGARQICYGSFVFANMTHGFQRHALRLMEERATTVGPAYSARLLFLPELDNITSLSLDIKLATFATILGQLAHHELKQLYAQCKAVWEADECCITEVRRSNAQLALTSGEAILLYLSQGASVVESMFRKDYLPFMVRFSSSATVIETINKIEAHQRLLCIPRNLQPVSQYTFPWGRELWTEAMGQLSTLLFKLYPGDSPPAPFLVSWVIINV